MAELVALKAFFVLGMVTAGVVALGIGRRARPWSGSWLAGWSLAGVSVALAANELVRVVAVVK